VPRKTGKEKVSEVRDEQDAGWVVKGAGRGDRFFTSSFGDLWLISRVIPFLLRNCPMVRNRRFPLKLLFSRMMIKVYVKDWLRERFYKKGGTFCKRL
jgi:hypothetical protein